MAKYLSLRLRVTNTEERGNSAAEVVAADVIGRVPPKLQRLALAGRLGDPHVEFPVCSEKLRGSAATLTDGIVLLGETGRREEGEGGRGVKLSYLMDDTAPSGTPMQKVRTDVAVKTDSEGLARQRSVRLLAAAHAFAEKSQSKACLGSHYRDHLLCQLVCSAWVHVLLPTVANGTLQSG